MPEVVLVQMPFAGLERPSIALGLISATLKTRGISTWSLYANIAFAERIGLDVHRLIEQAPLLNLIGEWLFAEAAFGARDESEGQLHHLAACARDLEPMLLRLVLGYRGYGDATALLLEVRQAAADFVEEQVHRILDSRAQIVGCTSMFQQHTASLALLRAIKRRAPDVITMIGGANCAGIMGRTTHRAFAWIDYTVTGEIDAHVGSFFASLLEPSRGHGVTSLPPNVLGKRDRGRNEGMPSFTSEMTVDMDHVATPDYDDYFAALTASPIGRYIVPALQFESSRGCWWGEKQHCTFCGLNANGMTYRVKAPDRTRREIHYLTERYGVRRLSAVDNIIDHSYFGTLLADLAKDDRGYEIFYETKANLKASQVETLARSGVRWIQPGIESLHDETLRLIRKGTTSVINIQLLKHCREFGVQPTWNILVGVPGERPEWLTSTTAMLPLLFHLPPPQGVAPIRFDRFSPLFFNAQQYGLSLKPFACYERIYPLDDAGLRDIAYYFTDSGGRTSTERTELWAGAVLTMDRKITQWQEQYWGPDRPRLTAEDTGQEIAILDTRQATRAQTHVLTGVSAKIYRLIAAPISEARILHECHALGESALAEEEIKARVSQLVEMGLAWRTNERIVALACGSPVGEMPSTSTVPPWGTVDLGRLFEDRRRFETWKSSSLAISSVFDPITPSPGDSPDRQAGR